MKRTIGWFLVLVLLAAHVTPAFAEVNVERRSDENPMVEVARSVMWGAAAGAVVGGAIALADSSPDNSDPVKWGIVGGTALGLVYGLWWSARRPSGAMIEIHDGTLRAQAIPPVELIVTPGGTREARLKVIGVTF
ncbi:MAG: hypothetical protein ACHQ52_14830 [Candidatus Eisenbacteria bacterium]